MGTVIRKVFIVVKDGIILDIWTNLKYLCEDMAKDGFTFPSYWTLAKDAVAAKKKGIFEIKAKDGQEYQILVRDVRIGENRTKERPAKKTEIDVDKMHPKK